MVQKYQNYEQARGYFSFLSFASWCVIILGVIVALVAMFAMGQMSRGYGGSSAAGLAGIIPGLAISFIGFLGLVFVQVGRAGVDTAEYTQQMLAIARDQLDVSKQALKAQSHQHAQSFSQLENSISQTQDTLAAVQGWAQFASGGNVLTPIDEEPEPEETSVEYRGETILISGDQFEVSGRLFRSMEKAESFVDMCLESEPVTAEGTKPDSNSGYASLNGSTPPEKPSHQAEYERVSVDSSAGASKSKVANGADADKKEPPLSKTKDNEIYEKQGMWWFKEMAFSTKEAAEKYVAQLGVNPNLKT